MAFPRVPLFHPPATFAIPTSFRPVPICTRRYPSLSPSVLPKPARFTPVPLVATMATATTPSLIKGTSTTVRFSRVVDGDTIRIFRPGAEKDESVRVLAIDTEETWRGGSKPATPWGAEASKFAKEYFSGVDEVTIEFPGNEPLDVAFEKYRGNFGRLLVFIYKNGEDFQELMIRKGYSPYFTKYGNAAFTSHHSRYVQAEREAQIEGIGVWDQITVNGSVMRNYAALKVWWDLRAKIIDEYRALKAKDDTVYNTRTDYAQLVQLAQAGESATIFTEVRTVRVVSGSLGLIGIGSEDRPFNLKIDDVESPEGDQLVNLLKNRYISTNESVPRRGYCYVTGRLEMYRGNPQMVLSGPQAITDVLGQRAEARSGDTVMTPVGDADGVANGTGGESKGLRIAALLPDPEGTDRGNETVTLRNGTSMGVDLTGWTLKDRGGRAEALNGNVPPKGDATVTLSGKYMLMNNTGDEISLVNAEGVVINVVSYTAADVVAGKSIEF